MRVSKQSQNYCDFYTTLHAYTPMKVYEEIFDAKAYFEDPFQNVKGVEKIFVIFQHMYQTLIEPSFEIMECVENDDLLYIQWKFYFKTKKDAGFESFIGVSRVTFNEAGKVTSHIDYWDAASHVYERIPLLGLILRWIKGKIRAS